MKQRRFVSVLLLAIAALLPAIYILPVDLPWTQNAYAQPRFNQPPAPPPPPTWTTPAYAAGTYTGSGSMTWTVDSGDVSTLAYTIQGKKMTVAITVGPTSVGGTPSNTLQVTIPDGRTAAKAMYNALGVLIDNSTRTTGTIGTAAASTLISIQRTDVANFTAATDATTVRGEITFEIQ